MKKTFLEVLLLIGGAVVIGVGWNLVSPNGIAIGKNHFAAATKREERRDATATPPAVKSSPKTSISSVPPPAKTAESKLAPAPSASEEPKEWEEDGLQFVNLPWVRPHFDDQTALFVDARKPAEYAEGHIPGAINISHFQSEELVPQFKEDLLSLPVIIVYCNGGECEESMELAADLSGYYDVEADRIRIYRGGFKEWSERSLPMAVGSEPGAAEGE